MKTSIQHPEPNGIVQPSGDQSRREGTLSAWRKLPGRFTFAALLAGLLFLLFSAPAARADRSPTNCLGSGLGISLYTSLPDVHIGDTIYYSVNVFNTAFPSCDAGETNPASAGAIRAWVVTPDGVTNNITLRRTFLAPGDSDFYANVVSYVIRAQDLIPDGMGGSMVSATAVDLGDIHQNDLNSQGGGHQQVNTEVNIPCIKITAQCVSSVGENGAITFTGTVTNCGNNTLVGVTVTNFVNNGAFTVLFPTNLAIGQVASFSGSWVPLNPCSPSTATLTAIGVDQFTSTPRAVTSSATITCQNTLTAGIKVTKSCPAQPVSPGQLLTFSGSVSNTGNVTLTNIVVVNNQPSPNTPVFTRPTLAPGEVVSFNGSYVAPTNCSVADTLTATATSRCGVGVSSVASATCPILTTPQITVTAVCPTSPVVPGGTLTYSGTIRNVGDTTLTNIVVVSDRPAPNTTIFTAATLAPGASANYSASFTVPANACTVTTTVAASGKDICTGNAAANTVSVTCTVTTAPAIAVTLACPAVPVATGGLITYTGTVRNSGNVTLNNVTVVNSQSVPSTVLTAPSLAPGASTNFTASFTAPADACSVSSTATASGSDNCTQAVVNNSASATCTLVTTPRIAVTQNCPANPASLGGVLTYSGTVSNAGNITLTNVVVTNDRTGASPVFTVATLAPGASANFTGSYTVPVNSGCAVTSTLTANGRDKCTGTLVTANAPATCPVLGAPNIAVTLACPVTPTPLGGLLTFSGAVSNAGNVTLTNVVVMREAPAPNTVVFSVASLAPGASANFTGSYTVPGSNACSITTSVSASANDQCAGSGVITRATISCPLVTTPRITVTQTCPANPVAPGGLIVYGGSVSNAGNITLTNIIVVSSQPAANTVVFTLGSLAPGAAASFSGSFNAPLDACSATSTLTATGQDQCTGNTVNNSVTTACPLVTAPQIRVAKACPITPVAEGGLLVFTGTVTNTGNITLTNIFVVNNQPAANTAVFGPLTLAPGAGTNFSGSYTAPLNACSVTDTLTASGRDKCTGSTVTNSITATCPITAAPAIAVTLACPVVPVATGGLITYTGTVRNSGNVTLNNVTVVNDKAVPGTVLTVPSLAPGASANFTASFTAPADACSVSSTVTASGSDNCMQTVVNNSASATCTLVTAPRLTVTQNCPANPASPGGVLTYSGTVCNAGNITLTNIVVFSDQHAPDTSGGPATFGTLTPPLVPPAGTVADRFGVGNNFNGLTFANQDEGYAANQFYSLRHEASGSYTFVTINASGTVTGRFDAGNKNFDALTFAAPDVGYGPVIFYYLRHDNAGVSSFGTIKPGGAVGVVADLFVVGNNLDALTFAATDVGYGANLFYYLRHDSNGRSTFGTINPVLPGTVTDRFNVGTNFDGLVFASTDVGYGANLFYYLRHDSNGRSTFGTISATGTVTDRFNVGTNFNELAFTTTDVGFGANLFYYLRAGGNPQPAFALPSLAPGACTNFIGSYTVPANSGCSITSTLTASAGDTCTGIRVTASASSTCPLLTTPRITVTQTCPVNPVSPGGILTYSGTVSNAGNITLTNIVVVNNRPADNTVIFTVATLAPGATANFTGSYEVPLNCCYVWSTVTASGKDTCTGVTVTDTDTAICSVLTMPKIVVTKVCPPAAVRVGEVLQYSGIVSNAGNITLINVIVVNAGPCSPPCGGSPCSGSLLLGPITLAPGESVRYYASYVVGPDFCGTDTVTACGLDACTYASVVSSMTTTCPIITSPRIFVTKNCPPQPTPHLGVLIFTGTVSNPGNVTLTNVFVVNNRPSNNTPVIGPITLAPNESVNFSGSYTTPQYCCDIVDTLTACGQDRCSGVQVVATASAICPLLNTPRITVTKDCPTNPVPVGGLFVFSGSVSNSGDTILTNVYVVSSQPSPNTPLLGPIELAPGEKKVFSGSYTVTANSDQATDTVTARGMNMCKGITATATANCFGPVLPLTITSVTLANGIATVTWAATPRTVYTLQYKTNLLDSTWISIPGNVTASGNTASINDAVGSTTQRFYRVMVVQ